eukprot:1474126-Rhodomonas_salina.2
MPSDSVARAFRAGAFVEGFTWNLIVMALLLCEVRPDAARGAPTMLCRTETVHAAAPDCHLVPSRLHPLA